MNLNIKKNMPRLLRFVPLMLLALVLCFTAFAPKAETAAAVTNMEQPSKKVLAGYVKKYLNKVTEYGYYYDEDADDFVEQEYTYYKINDKALASIGVEARAKVIATICNCYSGSFSSKDSETSEIIANLSNVYWYNDFGYIEFSEAPEFFKALAGYLNDYSYWYTVEELLGEQINTYIDQNTYDYCLNYSFIRDDYDYSYALQRYDQVLDMFTVTDGRITSGADRCTPVYTYTDSYYSSGSYKSCRRTVYLVTKSGTIKYESYDTSSRSVKSYSTKYISLTSAINKELSRALFTADQKSSMITVKAATEKNASKIHKALSNGSELLIKIKASEAKAVKIIDKLGNMVEDINGGGYKFMYELIPTAGDSCTYVMITEDYGKVYQLCAEFYERLETQYKEKAREQYYTLSSYSYYSSYYSDLNERLEVLEYLMNTDFKDLSDAAKVYAIDVSGIFDCVYSHPDDGSLQVVYVYKYYWDGSTYAEAMEDLLEGEAEGVCQVYADYEDLVFRTLGLETYINRNDNINHAWTVVKASNSSGKELWIPFDYGVGPAEGLNVSSAVREKYLATEEMRYALYLDGIDGAPSYKNFTMSDFLN